MAGLSLGLTNAEILLKAVDALIDRRAVVMHLENLVLRTVDGDHLALCVRTPVDPVLDDVILNERRIACCALILEPAVNAEAGVALHTAGLLVACLVVHADVLVVGCLLV